MQMNIKESLHSMLFCEHPINRVAQVVSQNIGIQWCADCGAIRQLGGKAENSWELCSGMNSIRAELMLEAFNKKEIE